MLLARPIRLGSVAAILLCTVSSFASAADALKKDDRIVFLGDSITQAGAGAGGYVTLVREAIKKDLPDLNIEVIGAGISGNRVPNLESRLDKDVIQKKPTIVVIYIGINDVWHSLNGRGTPKDEFDAGLRRIIGKIQEAGARVVLSTPSMIGEKADGSNPLDKMLEEYSEASRKVATDTKSQLLDLRKAFVAALKDKNDKNAEKGVLTSDGVHLNAAGNRFVADQMLAALGVKGSDKVADKGGKVLRHVVLFKFKADVPPEQVKEVVDAFAALPKKIDVIAGFEKGTDVSVENKSEGYTHGFVVTFKDEKGRDTYLPHPAHQELVKLVGPRLEKALVFDYWTAP